MTPEEKKYKAGHWIVGLFFSIILWWFIVGTILRTVEGVTP